MSRLFCSRLLPGLLTLGLLVDLPSPVEAAPRIIFSNIVGSCCSGTNVAGANFGAASLAEAFTPAATDTLTGVRVVVFSLQGADNHFNVSIFSDANGAPGTLIEQVGTNLPAFTPNPLFDFTTAQSTLKPTLQAGTQYWLVLTPVSSSTEIAWEQGGSPSAPARFTASTTGQGGWMPLSGGTANLQFEIDGAVDIPCTIGNQILTVVYVISGTRIEEFDTSGNFIVQFGGTGSGPGQFQLPSGLTVDTNGYVFVADAALNRIQKFDSCGNLILRFGSAGSAPGSLYQPYGLVEDPISRSTLWVADTGNNRIQVFDLSSGSFVTQLGGLGGGPGQFNAPVGLTIAGNALWVADTGNNRIQQFNLNPNRSSLGTPGELAASATTFNLDFGSYGSANGYFNGPFGVVSDGTSVWVADSFNHRIQQFTVAANFVQSIAPFSYPSPFGIAYGFSSVTGGFGIWAVDYNANTVTFYTPAGAKILTFGTTGGGPGQLYHPTYIAVGLNQSLV